MEENKVEKEIQKEPKKQFYKQKWFMIVVILSVMVIIGKVATNNKEKVNWSKLQLSEYIPEPKKGRIREGVDSDDYLSISIENVSNEYYEEYKKACIEKGYTVESEKSGDRYEAFNKEGYKLNIAYIGKEISLSLKAPEKMNEFTWPTNGIGAMLPATTSTLGKITSDSSNSFRIQVGNTTIEEYHQYVKSCEAKGFNLDYHREEKYYNAKNIEGYKLRLSYLGASQMEIAIEKPKEEKPTQNSNPEQNNETTNISQNSSYNTSTNSVGKNKEKDGEISKEFKKAMDHYEAFMDEYIAFMKKYANSNGTDLSLLSEYSKYMSQYAEVCKDFEKWKNEEINTKELAYYLEVQTRVNQKLLEITN